MDKNKILVVDDNKDICLLLQKYLTKNGYEVDKALTGSNAMELITKNRYDVVLCDFRLPDHDGFDILKQIKKTNPKTAVVMITAYSDIQTAVKCIKHGAFDYVAKPLNHEEILLTVEKAIKSDQSHVKKVNEDSAGKNGKSKKRTSPSFDEYVVGESSQAQHVEKLINLIAPTNMTVIIQGESGTGKEFVAQAIHKKSKRSKKPFVAIDCGALTEEIAGSELFGHIKGAFTGAVSNKTGQFEAANGGTLFLDEIGNLSYDNQVKLLRVLQERKVRRLGDTKDVEVDVRIIVASNEPLKEKVEDGKFREDLFYRLNEFVIDIEPLRQRKEDILVYADHFLNIANRELDKNVKGFEKGVKDVLKRYYWYGNLRELKNMIKRAVLLSEGEKLSIQALPEEITSPSKEDIREQVDYTPDENGFVDLKHVAEQAERHAIINVLTKTGYNKTKAADMLKIDRKTLYNKMKSYKIDFKI